MTLYLLVLMATSFLNGQPVAEVKAIIAQYHDPYDCEQMKAVLTGSTMPHEYPVCVPLEEKRTP